ncbi:ISAzo13-like element transposase-related protein [Micromonospora sagamiensis]|uniref:DDE family transposase n=1 Tax=Micromonospora sagamiensis TaxID=47875 RepID=A0A562WJL3_9ACTN|nr:hypothetical protein [Micromonospora sagamiensis]TWJ30385.1 DDE family transposase [Micromonospora sagamiensis]BCL16585.1 hypothetical protein GCM10017556_43240 [Micromonospora sagamiensis]
MLEPHLDERQRRLVLAARARSLGRGGISRIALAAGVHPSTVSKGIEELESPGARPARVRRPGGGRKRLTETDPGLMTDLLGLMEPRHQPRPVLQWTTRSTRRLAEELSGLGHRVSAWSVSRLLREAGFRLSTSSRPLLAGQQLDRDAQFHRVNDHVQRCVLAGQPVIVLSLRRRQQADAAGAGGPAVADTPTADPGAAGPAGEGDWTDQPVDRDTWAVALATVSSWWAESSQQARQLLIVADSAGGGGRSWRSGLARFAARIGVTITVCHLPSNTMRWNRGEDRVRSNVLLRLPGSVPARHEVEMRVLAESRDGAGPALIPPPPGPSSWNYLVTP